MGELHPTDGVMERAGFTSVYLDQEYSLVRNERSVLQQAEAFNHRHLPEHEVKTILNRYLFPRDVWNKPCGKLSGGEKMRPLLLLPDDCRQYPRICSFWTNPPTIWTSRA